VLSICFSMQLFLLPFQLLDLALMLHIASMLLHGVYQGHITGRYVHQHHLKSYVTR